MTIIAISAFQDNYIWAWKEPGANKAWVVDPGEAAPVIVTLKKWGVELAGILLTHHHRDHSGGIAELLQIWPESQVYGSTESSVDSITNRVQTSEVISCGATHFEVLAIPGHTLDHVAFWNKDALFCGDTLFSAGCGRVFEGTPAQMFKSLQSLIALPLTIKVYCGHEYTEANLAFARLVEPHNLLIQNKLKAVQALRKNNQPTLPSLLVDEKEINPFLRCGIPDVIKAAEHQAGYSLKTPVDVFTVLREWKNNLVF